MNLTSNTTSESLSGLEVVTLVGCSTGIMYNLLVVFAIATDPVELQTPTFWTLCGLLLTYVMYGVVSMVKIVVPGSRLPVQVYLWFMPCVYLNAYLAIYRFCAVILPVRWLFQ